MIRRGLVAAWAVLDTADVSAFAAYGATYTRETATFYQVGMGMKYEPFTARESKLAALWDDASVAAKEATYGSYNAAPLDFALRPCEDSGMTLEEARRLKGKADQARAVHNAVMKSRS
jgi:hypothetical protein